MPKLPYAENFFGLWHMSTYTPAATKVINSLKIVNCKDHKCQNFVNIYSVKMYKIISLGHIYVVSSAPID